MENLRERLDKLTKELLAESNPTSETSQAYAAELGVLQELLKSWRLWDNGRNVKVRVKLSKLTKSLLAEKDYSGAVAAELLYELKAVQELIKTLQLFDKTDEQLETDNADRRKSEATWS